MNAFIIFKYQNPIKAEQVGEEAFAQHINWKYENEHSKTKGREAILEKFLDKFCISLCILYLKSRSL